MNPLLLPLLVCLHAAGPDPVSDPVPTAVQRAVEAALARQAVEMVPGSLQRAPGPQCPPYRLFTFRDARAGRPRGVAVSEKGEVALSDSPAALGRFLAQTGLLATRPPREVLEVWRLLAQAGPIVEPADVAALPEAERAAVHAPRGARDEGLAAVQGFVRQGEELFAVEVALVEGPRARVSLRSLDEVLGRDEIDQAARALGARDEIVRAAAAFELAGRRDPRAFAALAAALGDRSGQVRATAAQGLRQQVALDASLRPRAVAALRRGLVGEADPIAREALAAALSALEPGGR